MQHRVPKRDAKRKGEQIKESRRHRGKLKKKHYYNFPQRNKYSSPQQELHGDEAVSEEPASQARGLGSESQHPHKSRLQCLASVTPLGETERDPGLSGQPSSLSGSTVFTERNYLKK